MHWPACAPRRLFQQPFRRDDVITAGTRLRLSEGARERFERRFTQVMGNVAVELHQMQIEPAVVGHGPEELANHLGFEVA